MVNSGQMGLENAINRRKNLNRHRNFRKTKVRVNSLNIPGSTVLERKVIITEPNITPYARLQVLAANHLLQTFAAYLMYIQNG